MTTLLSKTPEAILEAPYHMPYHEPPGADLSALIEETTSLEMVVGRQMDIQTDHMVCITHLVCSSASVMGSYSQLAAHLLPSMW